MRMRDDDGNWVTAGDRIRFSYGIPPVGVVGKVVEGKGTLWVLTTGHTPSDCPLRRLRRHVGEWFKVEGGGMKEKPILFSGEMVRAILERRKTQTRRVVKAPKWSKPEMAGVDYPCPYVVGMRLWVRETWADTAKECPRCPVSYRATWPKEDEECRDFKWRSPRFMPRWASRITLEVTGVRVERVQEITEEDAVAEGVWASRPIEYYSMAERAGVVYRSPRIAFRDLWDSINASRGYGWDVNPWVWVIEFKEVEK